MQLIAGTGLFYSFLNVTEYLTLLQGRFILIMTDVYFLNNSRHVEVISSLRILFFNCLVWHISVLLGESNFIVARSGISLVFILLFLFSV